MVQNLKLVNPETLIKGDTLLYEKDETIKFGIIKKSIIVNPNYSVVLLEQVKDDKNNSYANEYIKFKSDSVYFNELLNESVTIADGTEPFVNGVYYVNVTEDEIINRNQKVDEYTEKMLNDAKKGIIEPIKVRKSDLDEDTDNSENISTQLNSTNFTPIPVKRG